MSQETAWAVDPGSYASCLRVWDAWGSQATVTPRDLGRPGTPHSRARLACRRSALVCVERAVSEIGARQVIKKPRTAAGTRTVALPMWLMPELQAHFDRYAEGVTDGRVSVGSKGATPLRPKFSRVWARALAAAALHGVRLHDLRYTGNHFAAIAGASTRELMGRTGHASMHAALIYQHRTADRDRAIADAVDVMLRGMNEPPMTDEGQAEGTRGPMSRSRANGSGSLGGLELR